MGEMSLDSVVTGFLRPQRSLAELAQSLLALIQGHLPRRGIAQRLGAAERRTRKWLRPGSLR